MSYFKMSPSMSFYRDLIFVVLLILAVVVFVTFLVQSEDPETTPQDDHIQTVADFHEVMHRAKMRHSHPMPMPPKPPRGARI